MCVRWTRRPWAAYFEPTRTDNSMNAGECLHQTADKFGVAGDGRSLAIARTIREWANILGDRHDGRVVSAALIRLHSLYAERAETDAERARGKTCWDIGQAMERVLGAEHDHGSN